MERSRATAPRRVILSKPRAPYLFLEADLRLVAAGRHAMADGRFLERSLEAKHGMALNGTRVDGVARRSLRAPTRTTFRFRSQFPAIEPPSLDFRVRFVARRADRLE
jgi:hypothetical protein